MKNFIKELCNKIKRLTNPNGMKNYTIKFKATPSGYSKVFSIFTSNELVQVVSPYKP